MAFRCCPPVRKATDPARRSTRTMTARERQIYQAFLDAAASLQSGVDSATTRRLISQGIEAALAGIDTGAFVSALSPMVSAIQAQVAAGGSASMNELMRLTGATGILRFDELDPRALAWAETQAGRLIRQVTDEQRDILRRVLARSVENGWTVAQTTQDIRQVVGLHSRWATAVLNAKDNELARLLKSGMPDALAGQRADQFAERYRQRLLQARAKNIARTEILTASNQGRYLSWAQGIEQGYIAPDATKRWSTGPLVTRSPSRIQVCDICQAVRGEEQPWDTEFSVGVMMPPAHPSCRCTAELVPASIDEIRRRLQEGRPAPEQPAGIERVPGKGTPTGEPWDVDIPEFATTKEAEAWLQKRWGKRYKGDPVIPDMDKRDILLGEIDVVAARGIARDIDTLFKQYPAVAEEITKVGSAQRFGKTMNPNVGGVASHRNSYLYFNEDRYRDDFVTRAIRNKDVGWHSTSYPTKTIHHEFGHHMHFLIEKRVGLGVSSRLSERALWDALSPTVKETLGLKGNIGLSGAKTKQAVGAALSKYGATDVAEMIAEAVAEATSAQLSGEPARPLARAILRWLDEQLANAPVPR